MNTINGNTTGFELIEPASPVALMPGSWLWIWLAFAAMVVVLLVIVVLLMRKRKPAADDAARIRHAAFAGAITALANTRARDARDAAVQSSLIVRTYLLEVTGDPALFETHEEFVSRHDALKMLAADARAAAESGFSRIAALKYAPGTPDAVAAADVIAETRVLLENLHRGFAA